MTKLKSHNDSMIRLSLRLWGERLEGGAVSEILGVTPKYSYAKGYQKQLSSGKCTAPKDLGIWVLEHVVSNSLEDELMAFLAPMPACALTSIPGVEIAILDVYFGLTDTDSVLEKSFEFELSTETMARLVELDAKVRITIA